MLKNMKIGQRLGLGFGAVLVMLIAVAGVGYWTLSATARTATHILEADWPLVEASFHTRFEALKLRQYEKDLFLNIGDAEKEAHYLNLWTENQKLVHDALADVEKYAMSDSDHETVRSMRADLGVYEEAMQQIIGRDPRQGHHDAPGRQRGDHGAQERRPPARGVGRRARVAARQGLHGARQGGHGLHVAQRVAHRSPSSSSRSGSA